MHGDARRARASCLEDRQHERGGLAGAGLGAREDVAALERAGKHLDLHGRRLGVPLVEDGADERRGDRPERRERRGGDGLLDLGGHGRGGGRAASGRGESVIRLRRLADRTGLRCGRDVKEKRRRERLKFKKTQAFAAVPRRGT